MTSNGLFGEIGIVEVLPTAGESTIPPVRRANLKQSDWRSVADYPGAAALIDRKPIVSAGWTGVAESNTDTHT